MKHELKVGFVCLVVCVSVACGASHNGTQQSATTFTAPANSAPPANSTPTTNSAPPPSSSDQTPAVFSNINNNGSGWGSCTNCAGGGSLASSYGMEQFQTTPSLDGSSSEFYISATEPYSDALFWNKLGARNSASQFTWDFWVYLDQASLGAQALEYDMFQFADGVEYMFGSQCNYGSGYWDVWSQGAGQWVQTSLACKPFSPETWHHIVWKVHRSSDQMMHFESLTLDGVKNNLNLKQPPGPLPYGWGDDMGVQWQLDTGAAPLTFAEWIDNVTLSAE